MVSSRIRQDALLVLIVGWVLVSKFGIKMISGFTFALNSLHVLLHLIAKPFGCQVDFHVVARL